MTVKHMRLLTVDAFTDQPFRGNPAAVCLLDRERDAEWMQQVEAPPELLDALVARDAVYVGRNQFDYIVELRSEDEIRALQPDHAALRKLPVRGVIVTSRGANGEYDFVSRFFAPGSGVDEDPVTGSAHSCLAPYWSPRLGKKEFVAYQASARGGMLRVRLEGDRVKLGGRAVTVLRGDL